MNVVEADGLLPTTTERGVATPVTVLNPVAGLDPAPLVDAEVEVVDGTAWLVAGPTSSPDGNPPWAASTRRARSATSTHLLPA